MTRATGIGWYNPAAPSSRVMSPLLSIFLSTFFKEGLSARWQTRTTLCKLSSKRSGTRAASQSYVSLLTQRKRHAGIQERWMDGAVEKEGSKRLEHQGLRSTGERWNGGG